MHEINHIRDMVSVSIFVHIVVFMINARLHYRMRIGYCMASGTRLPIHQQVSEVDKHQFSWCVVLRKSRARARVFDSTFGLLKIALS